MLGLRYLNYFSNHTPIDADKIQTKRKETNISGTKYKPAVVQNERQVVQLKGLKVNPNLSGNRKALIEYHANKLPVIDRMSK